MICRGLTAFLFTLVCIGAALADDAPLGCRSRSHCCTQTSVCPSLGGSPDDYCRKPCPNIIGAPRCGGPDDYCRKPAPCLTDVSRCGGPDDYCKKTIPCLLCPPVSPHLFYGSGCVASQPPVISPAIHLIKK